MRILLVEDEPYIAALLRACLQRDHHAVDVAVDGSTGGEMASTTDYDLVILDRMLPDTDGLAICRDIRSQGLTVPVLMLTAMDSVPDRIAGLEGGADDYLAKPFELEELRARVRSLFRRHGSRSPLLTVGDLVMDPARRTVTRSGRPIPLARTEYALLEYLMRNAGQPLSHAALIEHVWGQGDSWAPPIVDDAIRSLQAAIDRDHPQTLIQTLPGTGYVLRTPGPRQTGHRQP